MTQSTSAPTERVKTSYWTWAVVGGGLLLTAAMAFLAWRAEALDRKAQIDRRVASFRAAFQEKRNGIEDLLLNLRALFNQTPNLSRESFRAAVEGLSIRVEGVQALGWAPVVRPEDRPRFLEQARAAQLNEFEFRQGDTAGGVKRAAPDATLASVLFVDPAAGNEHLLGLDLYSADLGHILQEAARTGNIMMSPKVQVRLQDHLAGGFIIAIAVYHPNMKPAEEQDRLGQLKGFVFALIAAQDMLGRLAGRVPDFNLDVMIVDTTAPPAHRLVCTHTASPTAEAEALKSEARFREDLVMEFPAEVGGFGWHFLFRRGPAWSDGRGIWFVPTVAGCGLLLTLLLRQRVQSAHRWTREVEHLVVLRTAELTNANTRLETEIRERQEVESALARERNILRNLVDRLPDAIAVTDMVGRVVAINAAQAHLPTAAAELPALPCAIADLGVAAFTQALEDSVRQTLASGEAVLNREIQARIQNEERTFVTSTLALCDAAGAINGVLAITRDTTDSRRAQHEREELLRKLQDTQKLESLGLLAGGIAHDFNNLLTAVLGNASLARMDVTEGSPTADCLGQIEEAALRAADLCKQMLAYSGKGRFVITDFDVTQLVQGTTELLRHSISKKAQLSLQLTTGLPAVTGDATQIRQILMNLVINASEAIGDRPGIIGVKTGAMHINATTLAGAAFESEIQHGAGVYIEVSDDGCGMTPETRARIFDPFFTTKFTGRGLGLAAVLGIARSHQGVLLVDSQVGRGSRFRLVLPVSAAQALPTPTTQENLLAGWQGSGSVLVVDDEAQIRILAARVLSGRGFKVDMAADGREAIEKLRKSPLGYRAVLLDLTMPGLDGVQTFRLLRECSPGVRVLLMSGYSEHEASGRFGPGGPGGFLQKPFRPEDLLRHLRALLESS